MLRFISLSIDVISAAVFILPFIIILGTAYLKDAKRSIFYTVFALYLSAVLSLVGVPQITSLTFDPTMELLPIVTIIDDITNCLLNVLLFVPLGIFLPMLWERFESLPRVALFGFCTSLVIEVLQLFTFRTTDIDDLIMNTVGAVAGYLIIKCVPQIKRLIEPETKTCDVYILCGAVLAIAFFVQPLVSSFLWDMIY